MTPKTFYNKTFQNKVSKLFPLNYGSKASSQDIKMKKGFLTYNISSNGIQKN